MPLHPVLHVMRFRRGLFLLTYHPLLTLMFLIIFATIWLLIAWAAARIAAERGHAFRMWFLASLLLGPFGLLAALVAPYTPERAAQTSSATPVEAPPSV